MKPHQLKGQWNSFFYCGQQSEYWCVMTHFDIENLSKWRIESDFEKIDIFSYYILHFTWRFWLSRVTVCPKFWFQSLESKQFMRCIKVALKSKEDKLSEITKISHSLVSKFRVAFHVFCAFSYKNDFRFFWRKTCPVDGKNIQFGRWNFPKEPILIKTTEN